MTSQSEAMAKINGIKKQMKILMVRIDKAQKDVEFWNQQRYDEQRLKLHKIYKTGVWDTCGWCVYDRPMYEHTDNDFERMLRGFHDDISTFENEIKKQE